LISQFSIVNKKCKVNAIQSVQKKGRKKYFNNQENPMQQVIRALLEYQLEIQEYQLMNYKEKYQ